MSGLFPHAAFRAQLDEGNLRAGAPAGSATDAVVRARALLREREALMRAPDCAGHRRACTRWECCRQLATQ